MYVLDTAACTFSKGKGSTFALAYHRTVFHLDDMDDLIKRLIAVSDIGRDNIESLELA